MYGLKFEEPITDYGTYLKCPSANLMDLGQQPEGGVCQLFLVINQYILSLAPSYTSKIPATRTSAENLGYPRSAT
jgi:hypothetical protein